MPSPVFTDEERAVLHHYLALRPGNRAGLGYWVAFVLPGIVFCAFGVFRVDPIAMAIGTAMLTGAATSVIAYGSRSSVILASIFQKLRPHIEPQGAGTDAGVPPAKESP